LSNKEDVKGKGKGKGRSTGLESDKSSVSDLTELSEGSSEEEEEEADEKADAEEKEGADEKEDTDEEEEGPEPEPEPAEEVKVETTENFVEWETVSHFCLVDFRSQLTFLDLCNSLRMGAHNRTLAKCYALCREGFVQGSHQRNRSYRNWGIEGLYSTLFLYTRISLLVF